METNINRAVLNPKVSINILNMHKLNIPNKREKLTNQVKKEEFTTVYKRQT